MIRAVAFMAGVRALAAGCLLWSASWCMAAERLTNSAFAGTPEVRVQIGSQQAQTSNAAPAEPSPLRPPLPPVPPSFWETNAAWIAGSLFALGIVTALLYWKFSKPATKQEELPAERARKSLGKWIGQPQTGRTLTSVSRALQAYYVREFKLPRQAYTTTDFEKALADTPQLPRSIAAAVIALLRECDSRKFAPGPSDAPFDAAGTALRLVNETEALKPTPRPAKR